MVKKQYLTKEEEIEYIRRIRKGDKTSLEEFIRMNQKLIISIAQRYAFNPEIFSDLIMEGNLGFMKAIEKYNIDKNTRFTTYSYFWIRKYIFNAIINQFQSIKAPEYVMILRKKYNDYISRSNLENNKNSTDKEISEHLGISLDLFSKIKHYFTYSQTSSSIKKDNEEIFDSFDIIEITNEGEKITNFINDEEILNRLFQRLKEKEKRSKTDVWLKILKMYFGLNGQRQCSYKEISKYFKISRQRIHHIIKTTIQKLQQQYKEMKNEGII
ncbi:MAG: sigma-70 family RNA polymerase sigma factor [Candidatus Omnitrophica bacterium]|jgi:RNA polymerase primary sigma factor|nr:sigma-70 family RNA polymerase sigma factor [Candidatus Omnitrophota bacterium]